MRGTVFDEHVAGPNPRWHERPAKLQLRARPQTPASVQTSRVASAASQARGFAIHLGGELMGSWVEPPRR